MKLPSGIQGSAPLVNALLVYQLHGLWRIGHEHYVVSYPYYNTMKMIRDLLIYFSQGHLMFGEKRGCEGRQPLTGARGVLAPFSIPPPQAGKKEN